MKNYKTAPYVEIAFRACFQPQSLSTYTKSPAPVKKGLIKSPYVSKAQLPVMAYQSNLNLLKSYGAMDMLEGDVMGVPKVALLAAAAGAGYYFFIHKKKKPARKRRANPRRRRRNSRKSRR